MYEYTYENYYRVSAITMHEANAGWHLYTSQVSDKRQPLILKIHSQRIWDSRGSFTKNRKLAEKDKIDLDSWNSARSMAALQQGNSEFAIYYYAQEQWWMANHLFCPGSRVIDAITSGKPWYWVTAENSCCFVGAPGFPLKSRLPLHPGELVLVQLAAQEGHPA